MGASLLFLAAALFFPMALSTFAFSRFTMVRIEREMKRDGLPRPAPWDELGLRLHWYAFALFGKAGEISDESTKPFIDADIVRSYATQADRVRAVVFLISSYLFFASVIGAGVILDL